MENQQICAMEWLHSIIPRTLGCAGAAPLATRGSSPSMGGRGALAGLSRRGEVNPSLQDTTSKANIQQHCGNESKSHSPQILPPQQHPQVVCLPRAAWAEFRKTQTQNLAAKG